jgi:hypothetical protein
MLADAVQVANGKLFILGGGWSITGPDPSPSAIAIMVTLGIHEIDKEYHWELALEDADGRPILFHGQGDPTPIHAQGDFRVTLATSVAQGSTVDIPLAVSFSPLPLPPGNRFTWRFTVDGEPLPGGTVSFATRPVDELR